MSTALCAVCGGEFEQAAQFDRRHAKGSNEGRRRCDGCQQAFVLGLRLLRDEGGLSEVARVCTQILDRAEADCRRDSASLPPPEAVDEAFSPPSTM